MAADLGAGHLGVVWRGMGFLFRETCVEYGIETPSVVLRGQPIRELNERPNVRHAIQLPNHVHMELSQSQALKIYY